MFLGYSDKLTETQTEIVYRYIHPISGEMFVRCAGIRDNSVTSCISIIGTHQDISETIRLEKEKEAERRLSDAHSQIPIIAMTANAFEEDRKRAIESGMNGYVTKPIKIEELISTIKKILKS